MLPTARPRPHCSAKQRSRSSVGWRRQHTVVVRSFISGDDVALPMRPRQTALQLGIDPMRVPSPLLRPEERRRMDEKPDLASPPEPATALLRHTDDAFRTQLTDLYRRLLMPGWVVLDLCSSWDSHLPSDVQYSQVLGHGLSEGELQANQRLTSHFVQDLNANTALPLANGGVDAVLCSNGMQYLTHPEWVAAELARVLVPGGCCLLTFSSHCYAHKATVGWLERDATQRLELLSRLLQGAGMVGVQTLRREGRWSPATPAAAAAAAGGSAPQGSACTAEHDPFYAVIAFKPVGSGVPRMGDASAAHTSATGAGAGGSSALDPARFAAGMVGPALKEMDELHPMPGNAMGAAQAQSLPQASAQAQQPFTIMGVVQAQPLGSQGVGVAGVGSVSVGSGGVGVATLERWHTAYQELAREARQLGIPSSALPEVPPSAGPEELRAARDHLQDLIASFMSAGL